MRGRLDDHRETAVAPYRYADDMAAFECGEIADYRILGVNPLAVLQISLATPDVLPEGDIAEETGVGLGVGGVTGGIHATRFQTTCFRRPRQFAVEFAQCPLGFVELPGLADHRAVGLELGERPVQ